MRRDGAAPALLVAFFAATLAMVFAVVVLLRGTHDWVDFAAIAMLVAFASALFILLARELAEEEPPGEDESDRGPGR